MDAGICAKELPGLAGERGDEGMERRRRVGWGEWDWDGGWRR